MDTASAGNSDRPATGHRLRWNGVQAFPRGAVTHGLARGDMERKDLTRFLNDLASGHRDAGSALLPHVYQELKLLARSHLRGQRTGHTLQPTALVHEAFLKLFGSGEGAWQNRQHFFAVAARAMRQILVDNARSKGRQKRGGGRPVLSVTEEAAVDAGRAVDVLDLDAALSELESLDARQAQVVELKYFGGLKMDEVASALGVSKSTAEREWRAARSWLGVKLLPGGAA